MPGLRHHFPHHGRQTNVFDAWLQFLHAMPRDQKNAMLDSDFDFFKSNAEHMDATDPVHAMCFDSMRTTLGGLWGRCLYCCSNPFRVHLQLLQCQEARCRVLSWFFDMQIASFVLCRIGIARVRSNPLWRWDCLSPKIALQQQPTRAHQDPSSLQVWGTRSAAMLIAPFKSSDLKVTGSKDHKWWEFVRRCAGT